MFCALLGGASDPHLQDRQSGTCRAVPRWVRALGAAALTSSGEVAVGFYQEQLLPRFQDKVMDRKDMREVRARGASGLSGEIVEVGFGTGLNTPYYPAEVTKVAALERPACACESLNLGSPAPQSMWV